jgi:hypothetical protein
VTHQIQRISGTKRESPRSRASSRASDIKESSNAVIRPRPIKQSPRTMTSLDHVDLWETSDGDDDDNIDDVCNSSNGFTAVPISSNSSTPTIPNTVHLFHPLRIDDLEDTSGLVRRSFSPVVCKRNRVESNNREREATQSRPQSRQSVISPRDHRSRPRSRCGRRESVGSADVAGPEMSVESPKIHDSTNTLRLFYQQHPNSVYSPVTDSKVFSDRRGGSTVHRKNAWTAIPAQPTTVVVNKETSSDDSETQIAKKSENEQQHHDKKIASNSSKTVKHKSTLPDPFRTQTLATNFGLRASYSFEDTSRHKVAHYLVKKVTFNRVVNVKDGEQSIREDLRSSNNSAQAIKAKHLPVIGRKSNSVVQSGTPITSC